jgi:hypothetical protein
MHVVVKIVMVRNKERYIFFIGHPFGDISTFYILVYFIPWINVVVDEFKKKRREEKIREEKKREEKKN